MAAMTRKDMRDMYRNCYSWFEILDAAVRSGVEFPDAISMMVWEFNLDDEDVEAIKDAYDNYA